MELKGIMYCGILNACCSSTEVGIIVGGRVPTVMSHEKIHEYHNSSAGKI